MLKPAQQRNQRDKICNPAHPSPSLLQPDLQSGVHVPPLKPAPQRNQRDKICNPAFIYHPLQPAPQRDLRDKICFLAL